MEIFSVFLQVSFGVKKEKTNLRCLNKIKIYFFLVNIMKIFRQNVYRLCIWRFVCFFEHEDIPSKFTFK